MTYYVETHAMENTGLDREVRFATRRETERALGSLRLWRAWADRHGQVPTIEQSDESATTTFAEWSAAA